MGYKGIGVSSSVLRLKAPVATYNDLPLIENTENDGRFTKDTDLLYTWTLAGASGTIDNWKLVGAISTMAWDNITDKPSSSVANIDDAVTKKHAQNTDTALGAQSEALDMNTHKITGVVDPTTDQEAATKKYVDENGGGDTLPIVDTTGIAKGSGDATKIVRLEVDGITTETTRALTVQDKDYTIADKAEVDKTKKTTLGITIDGGGIELTIG